MQEGAAFDDSNFGVRDGYLFNVKDGKTVTLLDGFRNFIMVIRL
jgi:hypothetical protein